MRHAAFVHNDHPIKPLDLIVSGASVKVAPGQKKLLAWDNVISLFGDSNLVNEGRNTARTDTHLHLKHIWGYSHGFDNEETWAEKAPQFHVSDPETGERIWTIMDDPEGVQQNPPVADQPDYRAQNTELLDRLARMEALFNERFGELPDEDIAPTPTPSTPAAGAGVVTGGPSVPKPKPQGAKPDDAK